MDAGRRLRRRGLHRKLRWIGGLSHTDKALHRKLRWIGGLSHTDKATIICALLITQPAPIRFSSTVPLTNLSLLET